jgi:hypothetical protein
MKKSIFSGLGITLPMLAISLIFYGQATAAGLPFSDNISSAESSASKTGTLHRSDIRSKAVRNFVRSYKNVSNEKWYNVQNGFIAMFILGDINYRVDYDKKETGFIPCGPMMKINCLPDIRHLVKSSYYDYNIVLCRK